MALYGYNLDGDVTSSSNLVNAAFSETYGFDGLNRMNSFSRGGTVLASWNLDSQGNKYNGPYGGSYNDWNKIIATSADNALDAETSVALTPARAGLPAIILYRRWRDRALYRPGDAAAATPERVASPRLRPRPEAERY